MDARKYSRRLLVAGGLFAALASAQTPPVGVGPDPVLPPPEHSFFPTVNVAPARGWTGNEKPVPAEGLEVAAFASGLAHPRWLYVLPNDDVLVAETNAPERPAEGHGLRGWFMKHYMKRAGAAVPSANRITLLRDLDSNGVADLHAVFLANLNSPFGMALYGNWLYVAETDAVRRFPYKNGALRIDEPGEKIIDLPAGPRNHHWTKNLVLSPDGRKLYVTIGSNSNAAENGMAEEIARAAVWEVDIESGKRRIFAAGLRNPNGLAWEPHTGALWTVVNERDELGNDLVPDFLTSLRDGGFYGWPYSYYGANVDDRVQPQRLDLVAQAIKPDYALGSHVAALGLAFSPDNIRFPETFRDGAFIGQHGSWNRKPRSGYNVVFVPFKDGHPSGLPTQVLGGFLSPDGEAYGRPVGVTFDHSGALLVADDVGGMVWRLQGTAAEPPSVGKVLRSLMKKLAPRPPKTRKETRVAQRTPVAPAHDIPSHAQVARKKTRVSTAHRKAKAAPVLTAPVTPPAPTKETITAEAAPAPAAPKAPAKVLIPSASLPPDDS